MVSVKKKRRITADKDGVIKRAEQIQSIQAGESPSRRRRASLASLFVSWICKAQLTTCLCQLVVRC